MLKAFRITFAILAVATIGVLGYTRWKDPEKEPVSQDARSDTPGAYIALDNGLVHYEMVPPPVFGDTGRVVVLIHGFSVPYYIWDSTVVALSAAGRRVLRYDLFGRGLSDRPDEPYDGETYDTQLAGMLDSLRIKRPVDLVGVSFGGYVAAHFASTHRKRVNTLTLIDPVSKRATLPRIVTLPIIGPWFWQTQVVPGMADGQPSDFLHPEHFPDWVSRYRPQMAFYGFGRALLRSRMTLATTDFFQLFSRVSIAEVPAILIWGKQDRTLPISNADSIRIAMPGVSLIIVDSAGHLPMLEQAGPTHSELLAFLGRHP